jgi:regulation of enolase protein 1 (concanavalin A-like superfamily)
LPRTGGAGTISRDKLLPPVTVDRQVVDFVGRLPAMRLFALFAIVVLAGACAPPAPAQAPWETVTSKEGQFTVEMPVKPSVTRSRTRTGPGGTVKVLMIGGKTDAGAYFVYKVEFPTAIVKGTEDEHLDAERDLFAEEWNGKVIAEKKVRAEGKVGRDFTIRGKPAEGAGVLTIRIREYLTGNAVYAVAVVSAPNRELPEDAGRFLGSLTIGEARARAAGTPEPEPAGRDQAGWGLAIDPDKDCRIRAEDRTLAIEVPGKLHDLNPDSGILNAPRAMSPVEGDFVLTVKVTGDFQPGGKSTNPKGVPYNGAGILIWSDSDNFIRLERGAVLRASKVGTYVAFEEREGGYRGAVHNEAFQGGSCYLVLQRKGSRILGGISADGSDWKKLKPIDTVWPAKLKVGLAAINSSTEPFAVKFEDFDLKTKVPAK